VRGAEGLREAHLEYLRRRFRIEAGALLPCMGAREAIFHVALCLVGRAGGRRTIVHPDPGYPVYAASAAFAGGVALPFPVTPDRGYLLEPWTLPRDVVRDTAAVWVNYPHNPTSTVPERGYWEKLIRWAHQNDVVVLSDECYVDVYDAAFDEPGRALDRPPSAIELGTDRILSFFSLSKRSGMTGYRSGFVAGDPAIIDAFLKARSYFGLASPEFIDQAAAVAWSDEEHAAARRREFSRRLRKWFPVFHDLGLVDAMPRATFYLWCRVPQRFGSDDVGFCTELAARGVLAAPSQWLGGALRGFSRFAMSVEDAEFEAAARIIQEVSRG
jgi:aspartate/methionine/tyrosine aminotransferase